MNNEYLTFGERLRAFWKNHSATIIAYFVCFAIGAAMAAIVIKNYDYASAVLDIQRYEILTNAFTIPGVILLCFGALSWVSQEGVFDGFAYAGRAFIRMFRRGREHVRYYDFVMERREKRKEKKGNMAPLLVSGLCYFAISMVFLYLYYQCPVA